jgi:hypothetical protein
MNYFYYGSDGNLRRIKSRNQCVSEKEYNDQLKSIQYLLGAYSTWPGTLSREDQEALERWDAYVKRVMMATVNGEIR